MPATNINESRSAIDSIPLEDRDSPSMTDAAFSQLRFVPRVTTLRRHLKLTQEEFAARYKIPVGTLRDWEQSRSEPDAPARAYLQAIAGDPEAVFLALEKAPKRPQP